MANASSGASSDIGIETDSPSTDTHTKHSDNTKIAKHKFHNISIFGAIPNLNMRTVLYASVHLLIETCQIKLRTSNSNVLTARLEGTLDAHEQRHRQQRRRRRFFHREATGTDADDMMRRRMVDTRDGGSGRWTAASGDIGAGRCAEVCRSGRRLAVEHFERIGGGFEERNGVGGRLDGVYQRRFGGKGWVFSTCIHRITA